MAWTATVATLPLARRTAMTAPARSIWAIIQPPKISPLALASAGMAIVLIAGSRSAGALVMEPPWLKFVRSNIGWLRDTRLLILVAAYPGNSEANFWGRTTMP